MPDLDAPEAHALIERAILVRYLEDRGILTEEYFHDIASSYRDSEHGLTNDYVAPNLQADIQFKNGTAYRQVRPTKLDKIKNLFVEVYPSGVIGHSPSPIGRFKRKSSR